MHRITIVGVTSLLLLSLSACSSNLATEPTTHHGNDHEHYPKHLAAPKIAAGVSRANFDRIQLAIQPEDYASTIEQVRALMGKPTKIGTMHLEQYDQPLKTFFWNNADDSLRGAVVSVCFHDDEVVGKFYHGAHLAPNDRLTVTALDQLYPGTAYERVTKRLGTPNRVTNVGLPQSSTQMITYNDIKDHPNANVTLTFERNQLIDQTRSAI